MFAASTNGRLSSGGAHSAWMAGQAAPRSRQVVGDGARGSSRRSEPLLAANAPAAWCSCGNACHAATIAFAAGTAASAAWPARRGGKEVEGL
eukprot:2960980-Rhodomonas_salina.1